MKPLFAIACAVLWLAAGAQSPYQFYRLYYDKGLTNSRVNAIVQDGQGYLWFGTQHGLNRYDGYTMRSFFADGKNGLHNNRISALYSDKSGRLWVGTYKGLLRYNPATETFAAGDTSSATGAAINEAFVNKLCEPGDGRLYLATNKSVYYLPAGDTTWTDVAKEVGLGPRFTNISDILFTQKKLLWVATNHKGFYKIDLAKKTATTFDYKTEFGDSCCYTINTLTAMDKDNIVAGMHSYGMAVFNTVSNTFRTVPGFLGKSDSIRYNSVTASLTDAQGRVWLGTTYFGLVQYRPHQNQVQAFGADAVNPFSYSGGAVASIYQDRQGSIWVGTFQKGVYRFHPDNPVVYHPSHPFTNAGLPYDEVESVLPNDAASVWLGTDKGPVLYNWKENTYTDLRSSTAFFKALPADRVNGMVKESNGTLWLATEKAGLIRYDAAANGFKRFTSGGGASGLPGAGLTHIALLNDDELLLVGARRIFRIGTKTFRTTRPDDTAFAPSALAQVSDVLRDGDNLWIGTYRNSLFQYSITAKKLVEHTAFAEAAVTGGIIYKLAVCAGKVVCGTVNGIAVYDPATKKVTTWLRGPRWHNITGLLADGETVWFSNEHTVGRLNIRTGAFSELHDEVNNHFLPFTGALARLPNGTVLCGTSKGFLTIDPARMAPVRKVFPPHLTAFRVFDKPVPLPASQIIDLAYDENFFSFDVSAFDYLQGEDAEYAYKLEGVDADWRHLGKRRTGAYTNIPGGEYRLKIKWRQPSGGWIENKEPLTIRIAEAFWQTLWFKVLMGVLMAALVYGFYRYRIGQVSKRAKLKADYEIKLNELENSALRTQMNPHFIFNSLNTINSFISRHETAQAHRYISKFSKLIRSILDHSRQRKILLSDELEVLKLYIEIESIRFEGKFDYSIEVDESIDASTVELPPLIIQPFVENAILHGLLPLPEKGFLRIAIQHQQDMLLCTVEDNGIGQEKAKALRKDFTAKHKSHGIAITRKRIELFNSEHGKAATVSVTDLAQEGRTGTRVTIPVAWEESF